MPIEKMSNYRVLCDHEGCSEFFIINTCSANEAWEILKERGLGWEKKFVPIDAGYELAYKNYFYCPEHSKLWRENTK